MHGRKTHSMAKWDLCSINCSLSSPSGVCVLLTLYRGTATCVPRFLSINQDNGYLWNCLFKLSLNPLCSAFSFLGFTKAVGWTILESPTQSPTQRPMMTLLHRAFKNPHLWERQVAFGQFSTRKVCLLIWSVYKSRYCMSTAQRAEWVEASVRDCSCLSH